MIFGKFFWTDEGIFGKTIEKVKKDINIKLVTTNRRRNYFSMRS